MARTSFCYFILLLSILHDVQGFHIGNAACSSQRTHLMLTGSKRTDSEDTPLTQSTEQEPPTDGLSSPSIPNKSWKHNMATIGLALTLSSASLSAFSACSASAYERTYPGELNEDYTYVDGRQRQLDKIKQREANAVAPVTLGPGYKPLSSILWGGALWLLAGSRSNPLVTPLANLVYSYNGNKDGEVYKENESDGDEEETPNIPVNESMESSTTMDSEDELAEATVSLSSSATSTTLSPSMIPTSPSVQPEASISNNRDWLQDRNDGLFADIPPTLYLILTVVFVSLGAIFDAGLMIATEGDRNVSLQLAGVSLISGASLELGRIASGEKGPTRSEAVRAQQLEEEFQQFATDRLKLGGNCHRSEVVQAFRRYYAQYRDDGLLGDLEIEQLLKRWTQQYCPQVERSAAGFYTGIQINTQADIFVQR